MEVRQPSRRAFFLESAAGPRFALLTLPVGELCGAVLHVHAFAEEMNKSRRMVALCAQALAAEGWMVLQVDCKGCGDSAGEFGDAQWQDWIDDLNLAHGWLRGQCGQKPLVIWTLRSGALVLSDWLERVRERPPLLFWQPVAIGKQHLTQFLRLKAAAGIKDAAQSRAVMDQVRKNLDRGVSVEVAGYRLSPRLAAGMGESSLRLPADYVGPVFVFEILPPDRMEGSPVLVSQVSLWNERGCKASLDVVAGPAFWQTQEIETVPGLIDASRRALRGLLQ